MKVVIIDNSAVLRNLEVGEDTADEGVFKKYL